MPSANSASACDGALAALFRARSGGKNRVRPLGVDGLVGGEQARTDEGE
jgi:hypothetical protein